MDTQGIESRHRQDAEHLGGSETKGIFVSVDDVDLYARYKDGRITSDSDLRRLLQLGYQFYKATGRYGRWVSDLAAVIGDDCIGG